jgi:protein-arginine kinase activator protein McsA
MLTNKGVLTRCKRCGKSSMSTEFVLDPVYKIMVCRNCVKERQAGEAPPVTKSAVPLKASQPVEKSRVTNRITNTPEPAKEQTAAGSSVKRKRRCSKCGYEYPYNAEKNYPLNCPNCGASSSTQFMSNMFR